MRPQSIDRAEIRTRYMMSDIPWVQPFLRSLWRPDTQICSWNTATKTRWRWAEKLEFKRQIEEESLSKMRQNEIAERIKFNTKMNSYYQTNTIALLTLISKSVDGTKLVDWVVTKVAASVTLSIKDRIEINREIRTQLWLPNNITSSSIVDPKDLPKENPASALLSLILQNEDEIQDSIAEWNQDPDGEVWTTDRWDSWADQSE